MKTEEECPQTLLGRMADKTSFYSRLPRFPEDGRPFKERVVEFEKECDRRYAQQLKKFERECEIYDELSKRPSFFKGVLIPFFIALPWIILASLAIDYFFK